MGLQFPVIDNTSASPIAGTFAGFAQNTEFELGANCFPISYTGGNGNDLTLTNVVPEPGSLCLGIFGALLFGLRRRSAGGVARPR